MEHVWVRAYVPYTDYRGAGNAGGEPLWIDLDTGIKAYESVENIYDTLEEQGFSEAVENITRGGDAAQIETLLDQWEEKLQSEDLSETYARKRVIKEEEVSCLPLSLQYAVEKESKTFAQTEASDKDKVSFAVNGDILAGFTASELQGKDILLSFQPASSADQEIYDRYSSIFDIPAYAVYMKPVLLVDNEVVAEGEEYLESTPGTRGSFTINLTSSGRNTSVTNDITTGSMYAVTLDSQSITAEELQSVYDEAAALKDSVTEENVYREAYLGKLLALAGKLYFAQVDIADTVAADMYDVSVTRSLSEGITGYEVRTSSLYGRITSLSEGSLYIDVDTDSHVVVSLEGGADAPREYMGATGIISSLYESVVWEQLTGYRSISTINVMEKAQEEDIEFLLISGANLNTEIEKLNADEATKQTIINAVNSGKVVTVPAEEVTIGGWHGTGYIVMNPETGAGEYMISGGLNGGSSSFIVYLKYLAGVVGKVGNLLLLVAGIIGLLSFVWVPGMDMVVAGMLFMLFLAIEDYVSYIDEYAQYLQTGDYRLEQQVEWEAQHSFTMFLLNLILMYGFWAMFDAPVPEEPMDGIIEGEGGGTGGGTTGGETGGISGGETGGGNGEISGGGETGGGTAGGEEGGTSGGETDSGTAEGGNISAGSGKYTETEIQSILNNIKGDGFKNNPLRQAYENEVVGLKSYGEELLASGMPEEQVARTLNQARRNLGVKYKDMTPQPLRDYIYEINMERYEGDKLGPTYDYLIKNGKSNKDIIDSSSRPNVNIDKLLSGFEEWLRRQ
ncbi:MAG: hypothetical protein NC300_12940 [Bacteroidales bacterium]|nr:hypothetical protein [Bacteroidales bacterium]